MSFKPRTIRRSPSDLRKYMRSYSFLKARNPFAMSLIEDEVKLAKERKHSVKKVKSDIEEAEELFKE